jgi:error-prone DNA polymerase
MVKGLSQSVAETIVANRESGRFENVQEMVNRCGIDRRQLSCLAASNSLAEISGHRHLAYWEAAGVEPATGVAGTPEFNEAEPLLQRPGNWDETLADYASTGLTLGNHPLALLRTRLSGQGIHPAADLARLESGQIISVAGLVINRQRPMTASGVVFMTLEDETGQANIVIWPKIVERQRRELMQSRLITVTGELQIESSVIHLIAHKLENCNDMIGSLSTRSRDFH